MFNAIISYSYLMSLKKTKHIAHRFFAGFMAVWLSGVVFLLCCERINGAPDSVEFCPLAKKSAHCDKAAKVDPANPTVSTGFNSVGCCDFLPAIFDKVRKIERAQKQIAITPEVVTPAANEFAAVDHTPIFTAYRSRNEAHQKLFIQNCMFRI